MTRPSMLNIWMDLAKSLAKRSTCGRKQVGTVITTDDMESVLSVGYNGNARGLPNHCDTDEMGHCGCIHSEVNALIKAGSRESKIAFITMSPCKACAKLLVNARVITVYFNELYRDLTGLVILYESGVAFKQILDNGSVLHSTQIKEWTEWQNNSN